jgi:hypothetical protein
MNTKVLYKGSMDGGATPVQGTRCALTILVDEVADTANSLEAARLLAITNHTTANLAGQRLYPYSTGIFAAELTSSQATWVRGATGDSNNGLVLVQLDFGYIDSSRTFGACTTYETSTLTLALYARDPATDYTNYAGGDTTTNVFTKLGGLRQNAHRVTEQNIIVRCRTLLNQSTWAQGLSGRLLSSSVAISGTTYVAGTLMFDGLGQQYMESQENICEFRFRYRPVWAWLADDVLNATTATSRKSCQTAAWTAPTL